MRSATCLSAPEQVSEGTNAKSFFLVACALLVASVLLWTAFTSYDNPDPLGRSAGHSAAVLDISVLVFREGLECVLVLAAITAGITRKRASYGTPVAIGVAMGMVATLATWAVAVRILNDLSRSIPALALQAATGLLAVVVLLVVMNWFFHRLYWTGWISFHNRRKQELLESSGSGESSRLGFLWGMGLLGFTSLYREGFEVVLFLQSYRLRLGNQIVFSGVIIGLLLTSAIAVLTFIAHRRLPYRKMLVLTGILLGIVLVVMVGEQAQEMQLARWIPVTQIHFLDGRIPGWMSLWLSVFPTVETLLAQAAAAALVIGSYFIVGGRSKPVGPSSAGSQPLESRVKPHQIPSASSAGFWKGEAHTR
ncbi:MAG TPA: FTR1 family protein [Candidatus Acidoferrum sp.]|nr:FTR1 family protein [Candidatus Acidoferrum sp.]